MIRWLIPFLLNLPFVSRTRRVNSLRLHFASRPALAHDWQEKSRNWRKITGAGAEFE
jgi:hypothetical protein